MYRFGRFNAGIQHRDKPVLFLDSCQQITQLRLVHEFRCTDDLRRAFDVHVRCGFISQHSWVAQCQSALRHAFVTLTLRRQLLQKVGADGF